jgi:guanine nucleotide-binding protein subunit alpha
MGCINSKPAEADKEAISRNARIDRSLKNDKKTLDRTIKILLLGA